MPDYTDTSVNNLIINKLTREKYNELLNSEAINEDELYFVTNTSIDAGNKPITNVGTPVNDSDAATKKYVDDNAGGSGAAAYNVSIASNMTLDNRGSGSSLWQYGAFTTFLFEDDSMTTYSPDQLYAIRGTTLPKKVKAMAVDCQIIESGGPLRENYIKYTSKGKEWGRYASVIGDNPPLDNFFVEQGLIPLVADITITAATKSGACMLKGTMITLADKSQKPIEEITYDDELLTWNFDEGRFDSAKPLWIKKSELADYYFNIKFSDDTELKITGKSKTGWGHRMLNLDRGEFRYMPASVGDKTVKLSDKSITGYKVVENIGCERKVGMCEYYNIITDKHMNLFANGILTSCSYNNLYPIENMKFVKDDRTFRKFEDYDVPENFFIGLRLSEQKTDISGTNDYVNKLIANDKGK